VIEPARLSGFFKNTKVSLIDDKYSMPEGPEVHSFADSLNRLLAEKYLIEITFDGSFGHLRDLDSIPTPIKLLNVTSQGKKIIFVFENGFLLSSLGLEGSWYLGDDRSSTLFSSIWGEKHSDDYFEIEEVLSYKDTRHFGWIEWFPTAEALERRLDLGVDLLNAPPTLEEWCKVMKRPRSGTSICTLLLDQKYFSGIGNYLRAEILYAARIHPQRTVGSLSKGEHEALWENSLRIIKEAYDARGASLRTYRDLLGNRGTFQVVVYGQKHDPLGNPVKSEKDKSNRTIWYVPALQKL
jgi:formamidopyrimidine-DNA glycosylase